MAGVQYVQARLHPPCSVRVPLGQDWRLYAIRGGEVTFEADDAARTRQLLPPGSVIAMSGVLQHRFRCGPEARGLRDIGWREEPLGPILAGHTTVAVGRISKDRMAFLNPFERISVLRSDLHPVFTARIAQMLDRIVEETACPSPTATAMIQRLSEIIALEVGRFESTTGGTRERSTRQAAADHRILRAVAAFYAAPGEKWSVERLADIACMSRTAFAVRYRELIGTTPLKSLRQLRMQLAATELSQGGARASVDVAARRAGYRSNSTFIRAFAGEFGTTPGRARK